MCALVVIGRICCHSYWAYLAQVVVSTLTICAERKLLGIAQIALLVPVELMLKATTIPVAIAISFMAVCFQVVVGHWWIELNVPSAASDGLTVWSIVYQVAVVWESLALALWRKFCRAVCFMTWAASPAVVARCRMLSPREFFYSLQGERIQIETVDGERLQGFVLCPPSASIRQGRAPLSEELIRASRIVLFLHGNGGTRYGVFSRLPSPRVELCRALAALFDTFVVGIDYRGFADSTGSPSENGLALDAQAALEWCQCAAPDAKIVLYGQSLGSIVASRLAASCPVDGLILDATFPSARDAALTYPFVRFLAFFCRAIGLLDHALSTMPDAFESRAHHVNPSVPLLVVHKAFDEVIPLSLGKKVFDSVKATRIKFATAAASKSFTRFVQIDGSTKIMRKHHTDAFTSPLWAAALYDFFQVVGT